MASTPPKYLLLLTPPPSNPSYAALRAAYSPPLTSVLKGISELPNQSSRAAVLEIALPCPHLHNFAAFPRSRSYQYTQRLLAALYQLLSIISAKNNIDVEGSGGVSTRLLLLTYDRTQTYTSGSGHLTSTDTRQGPVIDLPTLVLSGRKWKRVYSVESEIGESITKAFIRLSDNAPGTIIPSSGIERVTGGVSLLDEKDAVVEQPQEEYELKSHRHIAVGGTFDHLHAGHKLLLTMTAFLLDPPGTFNTSIQKRIVTVGITGDELLKNKKYAEYLESWEERESDVTEFLSAILDFNHHGSTVKTEKLDEPGPNGVAIHRIFYPDLVVQNVKIIDPFGPTITDETITALVVSGETRSGGQAINEKREGAGWKPLEVFEVDVLDSEEAAEDSGATKENFASKISSTAIRRLRQEKAKTNCN